MAAGAKRTAYPYFRGSRESAALGRQNGDRSVSQWECLFCGGACEMWMLASGKLGVSHALPTCLDFDLLDVDAFVHKSTEAQAKQVHRKRVFA